MHVINGSAIKYAQCVAEVATKLKDHPGPIVILSHESPDGDALGSVLGLARALKAIGKTIITPMDVPRYLRFLPEEGEISSPIQTWPDNTLAVVLDVDNNDPNRVAGADLTTFTGEVVNIDHHGTNVQRATLGLVDSSKPATAMIIADVVNVLGSGWSEQIATPLMLGLNTDTGSFRFNSVTPEAFDTASLLLKYGARLGWLNDQLSQNPHSYYFLLKEVLNTLEFSYDGRVVIAKVDQAMLTRASATWEEVESYVSLLRSAQGTVLAVMIKDFGDRVKLSLRSRGNVSAQNIAVALGGGGHIPAAGAALALPYSEVRSQLDKAINAELTRASKTDN